MEVDFRWGYFLLRFFFGLITGGSCFFSKPYPVSHYACGWGIATRPWAGGPCLTHNGSNQANYFAAWLAPEKGFGVIAATNQGGPAGAAACDAACSLMISAG